MVQPRQYFYAENQPCAYTFPQRRSIDEEIHPYVPRPCSPLHCHPSAASTKRLRHLSGKSNRRSSCRWLCRSILYYGTRSHQSSSSLRKVNPQLRGKHSKTLARPGFSLFRKNSPTQKILNQTTSLFSSALPPQPVSAHSSPPPRPPEPSSSTRSPPYHPRSTNPPPSPQTHRPTQSASPEASASPRHADLCAARLTPPYAAAETSSAPSPRSPSMPLQSQSMCASPPAHLPAPLTPARSVETDHSVPCSKSYHTHLIAVACFYIRTESVVV